MKNKEHVLHCAQWFRVVTKISSCWVNTTSRRGIKWLGISFGSIFVLFFKKSSRGPLSQQPGENPRPPALNDNPGGCLLCPLYYPNMMHIKFLLPTALIKQPTRSQELPYDICLPTQGKVKKFKKIAGPLGNLWPKFTNSEQSCRPTNLLSC